jgi:hypothetical protein
MEFLPVKNYPIKDGYGLDGATAVYAQTLDRIYIFSAYTYEEPLNNGGPKGNQTGGYLDGIWHIDLSPLSSTPISTQGCSNFPTGKYMRPSHTAKARGWAKNGRGFSRRPRT